MWQSTEDANNRIYYYNTSTGEATWDKPRELWTPLDLALDEAGWKEHSTEDGRKYWHNHQSNQSVWILPEEFNNISNEFSSQSSKVTDTVAAVSSSKITPESLAPTEKLDFVYKSMFERLGVLGMSYCEALPLLVQEPDFWLESQPSERKGHFDRFQETAGLRDKSEALNAIKKRVQDLVSSLADSFKPGDALSWETMQRLEAYPGSVQEKALALRTFVATIEPHTQELRTKATEDGVSQLRALFQTTRKTNAWDTLRQLLELQLDLDPLCVRSELVNVYRENAEKWRAQDRELAAAEAMKYQRQERKARQAFVKRLEQLKLDGVLTSETKWPAVRDMLVAETEAMAGNAGSTPIELFHEAVANEKRRVKVQLGLAVDALAAANLRVIDLTLAEFSDLLKDNERITDTKQVYELLRLDWFESARGYGRGGAASFHHKPPTLEY